MLILRGEWSAAEVVLDEAVAVLPTRSGEGSDARARLAELRRRQGRTEEALALIAQAEHQPIAALSQAAIALERGDPTAAAEGAARHLRLLGGAKTERAAGLELLAEAHAAAGQAADAAEAAGELLTIAEAAGTEPLLGAARHAEGCASAAAGSYEEAREAFEDARQTLERLRRLLLLERLREEPSRRLPVGLAQRLLRSAEQTIRRGDRIRHLAPWFRRSDEGTRHARVGQPPRPPQGTIWARRRRSPVRRAGRWSPNSSASTSLVERDVRSRTGGRVWRELVIACPTITMTVRSSDPTAACPGQTGDRVRDLRGMIDDHEFVARRARQQNMPICSAFA